MNILTATHSSLPHSVSHSEALKKLKKGEETPIDFQAIRHDNRRSVLQDQVKCNLDIITDGQFDWQDEIYYLFSKFPNATAVPDDTITIDPIRYKYIRPTLHKRCDLINDDFLFEAEVNEIMQYNVSHGELKFCLPGPYSLFCMSINQTGIGPAGYLLSLARVVASQVKHLFKHFTWVQINEPAIAFWPESTDYITMGTEALFSYLKRDAEANSYMNLDKLVFHTPYGNMSLSLLRELTRLGTFRGIWGVQVVNAEEMYECVGAGHGLQLGIIDSDNRVIQNTDVLVNKVRSIIKILGDMKNKTLILTTNGGLKQSTPESARFKMLQTVALANLIKD